MKTHYIIGFIGCVSLIGAMYFVYQKPKPDCAYLCSQANQYLNAGNYDKALMLYDTILKYDPQCSIVHFNKGQAYYKKNDFMRAYNAYQQSLEYMPDAPYADHAYFQLGCCLQNMDKKKEAISYFKKVIIVNPHYGEALLKLAQAYQEQHNHQQTMFYYKKAVACNKAYIPYLVQYALVLRDQGLFSEAIECLEYGYALNSCDANICQYLADVMHMQGRLTNNNDAIKRAKQLYEQVCVLNPTSYEAYHNIGLMYIDVHEVTKALEWLHKALTIDPQSWRTEFGLATVYLQIGDFQKGWPLYESRWKKLLQNKYAHIPQWDGTQGKKVLFHAEQGLGDTFQFIRYLALAKQKGITTIVEVQKPLKNIFSTCPFIDTLITQGETPPTCDAQIPLLSLPAVFHTTLDTIPAHVPYIKPDAQLVDYWRTKLADDHHFKVGICWQVDATHDFLGYIGSQKKLHVPIQVRSIPTSTIIPLLRVPGVTFYSLQKNYAPGVYEMIKKEPIVTFDSSFDVKHGSFMDSAALMQNLDLVISVDTSIAHLAGALGVKTWVMLPYNAEWRWLLDRNDTPWYPTMQLFRQPKNDWEYVVQQVIEALKVAMKNKSQLNSVGS